MQLQLSLAVADRLHEALLVRGVPIDVREAACLLTASSDCPPALCRDILGTLVAQDRRFCWSEPDMDDPCGEIEPRGGRETRVCLCHWQAPDPDLASVPFVALDLETTGARAGSSKITEIGAVRIEGFREVATFGTLVNPLRPIPRMITEITGITPEMVADAPRIEEVIPELMRFLEGAVVVAHNACFDVSFLNYELRRLKGRELGDGAIDTLPLARALAPGLPNYKLGTVAAALGAPVAACHRALADAQAAGHVFVTLMQRLQEQGVTRLSEARAFMVTSSRAATEKLTLTRDLPAAPGCYRFVDRDGRVVFVGQGERLREHVRAHFTGLPSSARKMRQAVRMVERIDWEEAHSPLEAVLREQELILEHRPSCNQHGGRPETYAYLKVRESGPGLCLYASNRRPKVLSSRSADKGGRSQLIIGPFRGRSRLTTALELLQRCYPIRRCPRHPEERPCPRGQTQECMAPCLGDPAVRQAHDVLVRQVVGWLTGRADGDGLDPLARVEELRAELCGRRLHEEAEWVRKAADDLLSVRRSYTALAEAAKLRFAALWRESSNGDEPSVRLNLVWNGHVHRCVSLRRDDLEQSLAAALACCEVPGGPTTPVGTPGRRNGRRATGDPIAVWQDELDALLAVRRWFREAAEPDAVLVTASGPTRAHLDVWRERLLAEALRLLD